MLKKIIYFLKYNNATIIILAVILILGGGALAAGPEAVGQKQTNIQGLDNTALLAADLDKFNMDFKIENLEQDEKYYYATYSFLDLTLADSVWQYQLNQRRQKISKKIKEDLGAYLVKFLAKHYEARLRELKQEKNQAQSQGEQKRVAVTEYSGLIGRTLDLASKVFPGYEPVVKRELPTPDFSLPAELANLNNPPHPPYQAGATTGADSLTQVYNDYVAAHDQDADGVLDLADNCPDLANPDQLDSNGNGLGEVCDRATSTPEPSGAPADTASSSPETAVPETPALAEPTTVEVIELPGATATEPAPEPPSASEPGPGPGPETAPESELAE